MTRHNMGMPKVALPALWDDAAHGVSQSALARCQEMQREAADAEDYETASILKQLVAVLRPRSRRSVLDCSPAGAAAKAQVCSVHPSFPLSPSPPPSASASVCLTTCQITSICVPSLTATL